MMAMGAAMSGAAGGAAPKTCAMEPVPEYVCGCQSAMGRMGGGLCDDTVVGVESVSATYQSAKPGEMIPGTGEMFPGAQHTPPVNN